MFYGVKLTQTESGFELSCKDMPEYVSEFATEQEARDAIGEFLPGLMIKAYRRKRLAIPLPSPVQEGELQVHIPVKAQAKILFWNFMVAKNYRVADVARIIGCSHVMASRLVDMSKDLASVDAIESALRKLGGSFDLTIK